MQKLYALGIPLDFIDKVFLTHLHADHMGDLPGFYIYGPQNNRSVPLRVWGPGGGGTRPEWGTKAAMDNMLEMWAWMTGTLAGTIDTRSMSLKVTEFDWTKVNGVIYEDNGVVIRSIPAVHFEQSVSFIFGMERSQTGVLRGYASEQMVDQAHPGGGPLDSRVHLHAQHGHVEVEVLGTGGLECHDQDPCQSRVLRQGDGHDTAKSMPSLTISKMTSTPFRPP